MKQILTVIAVAAVAIIAFFLFSSMLIWIAIALGLAIVGWLLGVPVTVTFDKKDGTKEVRKYRYLKRIG